MTGQRSEPGVAITLLQSFCRDEALVGDILEEYEVRQSRAWLWRQVLAAIAFGLPYGMIRRTTASGRPPGRMPMPIGGIGLLGIIALITFVAPGAWWLIGMGIAGGGVIGFLLIRRAATHQPDAPLSLK